MQKPFSFLFLGVFLLTTGSLLSQSPGFIHPDSILIGDRPIPKILLVGTWHFDYPNLDAHQIAEEDQVNIFSDKKQAELQELLDYIAQFQPTKIAVEGGRNTGYLLRRWERWKSGERPLGADEIDQIAIRLGDRLGLDTLYGVDAYPLLVELYENRDTTLPYTYVDSILFRHYFGGDDEISRRYTEFFGYKTEMTKKATLLENFLYINSDDVLDRGFGAYLAGGQFGSENFEGADALSMFWFNRNLRIYRNIQNIVTSPDDRILVLFGSGHIAILRYLFECTPQFELIDFGALGE